MSFFTLFMAFPVLLVIGFTWFFIYYFNNPILENPEGIARVVGNCGDTMEIGLNFKDGRVDATHFWTNGCSFSKHCVETAVNLARAKNLEELKKINMVSIMDEVGQLPETHLHCAQLVPYSRKSVTQFSPHALRRTLFSTHALRGIKNKKSGGYYKIRMLK